MLALSLHGRLSRRRPSPTPCRERGALDHGRGRSRGQRAWWCAALLGSLPLLHPRGPIAGPRPPIAQLMEGCRRGASGRVALAIVGAPPRGSCAPRARITGLAVPGAAARAGRHRLREGGRSNHPPAVLANWRVVRATLGRRLVDAGREERTYAHRP
eukprot:scaffold906_cov395-Prasinococcus_capsulatus_cf.AAC.4